MASLGQASSSIGLGFSSRTQQRAPKQLPIILPRPPAPGLSLFCGSIVSGNVRSGFYGQGKQVAPSFSTASSSSSPVATMMTKPAIQFIRGIDEQTIPDVSLTRSRDGNNGVATFMFDQPSVFDSSRELGDITGLYLIDEEGMLQTVDVSAKFQNGRPVKIESKYVMRNAMEWDRFMRFMERYAEANGLGFVKK